MAEMKTSSSQRKVLTKAATELREPFELSTQNVEASDALALAEWRLGDQDAAVTRLQEL